jgi:hypothetical protein
MQGDQGGEYRNRDERHVPGVGEQRFGGHENITFRVLRSVLHLRRGERQDTGNRVHE